MTTFQPVSYRALDEASMLMEAENLKEGGYDVFPGTIPTFASRMRDTETKTLRIYGKVVQV
jgi:hypothetical protein